MALRKPTFEVCKEETLVCERDGRKSEMEERYQENMVLMVTRVLLLLLFFAAV